MDKIANGFTMPFSSSRAFRERPGENGWNFLEMARARPEFEKWKTSRFGGPPSSPPRIDFVSLDTSYVYKPRTKYTESNGRFLELLLQLNFSVLILTRELEYWG